MRLHETAKLREVGRLVEDFMPGNRQGDFQSVAPGQCDHDLAGVLADRDAGAGQGSAGHRLRHQAEAVQPYVSAQDLQCALTGLVRVATADGRAQVLTAPGEATALPDPHFVTPRWYGTAAAEEELPAEHLDAFLRRLGGR